MADYIAPLQNLIEQFRRLPGVGSKTAVRYALALLKLSEEETERFADAIIGAKRDVHTCRICGNIAEGEICSICSDSDRDRSLICVVEDPQDIMAFERIRSFSGVYHVLGGVLSPRRQVSASHLRISELSDRIKEGDVKEVVIATNPTFDGDTTALYLAKQLSTQYPDLLVTRLAYGIPVGGDVEYADEVTLDRALRGRSHIQ